jgi:hypothetical protein
MQSVRVLALFAIAIIIMMMGVLPQQAAAATLAQDEPVPTPTVEPPDGYPGTEFTFTAYGFHPRERVSFWVNAPDGSVHAGPNYSVNATIAGEATWTWQSATDAMTGRWSVVAEGIQSHVQHVITFTMNDGTTIDPETGLTVLPDQSRRGVEPTIGVAGTQFHFFAGNFRQNEMVSFWVHNPANRVFGDDSYQVQANEQGFADWLWVSSVTDRSGTWTMVAVGQQSGVVQTILFEIE